MSQDLAATVAGLEALREREYSKMGMRADWDELANKHIATLTDAIAMLRSLAPSEPVAWRFSLVEDGDEVRFKDGGAEPESSEPIAYKQPLYAGPVAPYWPPSTEQRKLAARMEVVPSDNEAVHLECVSENGVISMRLGVKTLAHATNICPELWDAERDRGSYKVTDPAAFAKEVVRKINAEDEQGNTMLTALFDKAIADAINWGAEGVEENDGHDKNSRPQEE